jgi:hypothetical protein
MDKFSKWFLYLWVAAIIWSIGIATFMAIRRRNAGQPVFRPGFDDAFYLDTWRSGRSNRSLLAKLGGANNCLWVAVTHEGLWICPHFPFSLMAFTKRFGLEHKVPASDIQWVARSDGGLSRMTRICITNEAGNEEILEINLRRYEDFMAAIAKIKAPQSSK